MLRKIVILISFLSVLRAQYEDESPYPQTDEEMCVGQEDGLLFGLENECDSYYYCSGEIAYLDKCSDYCEGCQFDFKINDCNYAEEAQCFVDETQAPETTLPPQTQAPVTTTAAPPSQTTAISDVTCPTDKIEFLASANCSEYYICVYGTKVTMQCQDGFVFNVEDKKCDHPVYSPRCSGISMDNLNNVKCNRHGFYTTAYPMDCEKYVFCSEGIPMVIFNFYFVPIYFYNCFQIGSKMSFWNGMEYRSLCGAKICAMSRHPTF